ncbi:MAG: hypothetical protein R8N23_06645 [Reichenbachiella sp.]|uniref:hypothetical protein n=1 Tax=Reichenbachiella sp. TaxID=2184521 RepID=UPI002966DD36|nr:hypothetical protein [Reichenbachiella sp.]MDW3209523.1 hypothetical protein [Reichenbachiella sp.]
MSNKGWKDFTVGFMVVAGLIILWLVSDRKKILTKLSELEKEINQNKNLDEEIKGRLKELVSSNAELDNDIKNELISISALIDIKQETKALAALAKVIENLLKKLYKNDSGFKEFLTVKNGKPVFHNYLEYANKQGLISNEDFHLISLLKIIRNQEAHEVNVKKEPSKIIAAFISGISLIMVLSSRLANLQRKIAEELISKGKSQE